MFSSVSAILSKLLVSHRYTEGLFMAIGKQVSCSHLVTFKWNGWVSFYNMQSYCCQGAYFNLSYDLFVNLSSFQYLKLTRYSAKHRTPKRDTNCGLLALKIPAYFLSTPSDLLIRVLLLFKRCYLCLMSNNILCLILAVHHCQRTPCAYRPCARAALSTEWHCFTSKDVKAF